jgi:hypothetical protein
MIRLKVYEEDYDHNPRSRDWLVNPAHITAVEFCEEHRYHDGKVMRPACAIVYLLGHLSACEGMGSSSDPLQVRDKESLALLRSLGNATPTLLPGPRPA